MNIAVGALAQETNTFSGNKTTIDDFRRNFLFEGGAVIEKLLPTRTEVGGFLSSIAENNDRALATIAAWANPSGTAEAGVVDFFSRKLERYKKELAESDAVLFAMHGAMAAENDDDAEGFFLGKIRSFAGKKPIVCSLDMHANVTDRMMQAAYLVGYRTYPHKDAFETGWRAFCVLKELLKTDVEVLYARLPMVLPVYNAQTTTGPMQRIVHKLEEYENDGTILSGSVFTPHPWLDIRGCAAMIYFIVEKDEVGPAKTKLIELAQDLWTSRFEFLGKVYDFDTALAKAESEEMFPALFIDSGDVVSAGSDGQSTFMLERFLRRPTGWRTVLTICEPAVVHQLETAKTSDSVEAAFGDEGGADHRRPVMLSADLIFKTGKPYIMQGDFNTNIRIDCGKRCVLKSDSVTIIVTEHHDFASDVDFYTTAGIDLRKQDIIVVKSHKFAIASLSDYVRGHFYINTPGCTPVDITGEHFNKIEHPLFPYDNIAEEEFNRLMRTNFS